MKYNQIVIIKKINTYLKFNKRKFTFPQVYCHGLTLLWLYKMFEKKEKWYYDLIKKIVKSSKPILKHPNIDIEKFIAHIVWLQKPEIIVPSIRQMDMDKTLEVEKEMSVSSVLTPEQLDLILELVIPPEKMICIVGPDRSVGVFRRGLHYHFFDSDDDSGIAKILHSISTLRVEIINCLFTKFNYSGKKVAITINVLGNGEPDAKKEIVYQWIMNSTDIMSFCDAGIGALYLACENNHESLVTLLLKKGVDPNQPTLNGRYPLVLASYSGYSNLVFLLLKYGAKPNLEGREGLPLYLAVKHGHEATVNVLLQAAALVNKSDRDGDTAIFIAVESGHLPLIQLLLKHKADPLQARNNGDTALSIAIQRKNWNAVVIMLIYINLSYLNHFSTLKYDIKNLKFAVNQVEDKKIISMSESQKLINIIDEIATQKIGLPNLKRQIVSFRS